jgi:hypothetical protein
MKTKWIITPTLYYLLAHTRKEAKIALIANVLVLFYIITAIVTVDLKTRSPPFRLTPFTNF